MTIAIPLTVQIDYTELKYCLRSIEKFLPEMEVVIIGDHMPEWITGVTQIVLPDIPWRKQLSIRRKILAALEYAEEILFLNDDVYLLQPTTDFPYYWHGMLKNYSESGARPLQKQLEAIWTWEFKHFDGHYPLMYYQDFKSVSQRFSEDVIIKSMYCNALGMNGTFAPDCKLLTAMKQDAIREFIKDRPCFSTGVYSLPSALSILHELFPEQSKYEL